MNRLRKYTAITIVLFTAVVLALVLAEVFVAMFKPQPIWRTLRADTPAMHVSDPVVAHSLIAGYSGPFVRPEFNTTVSINSRGFRGPELSDSDSDSVRILIIGDSFTFGHGVDDNQTYPYILNYKLSSAEIVNGGFTAGSSPDMYYAWLSADRLSKDFSGVIIGFFVGNDIDQHPEMVWQSVDISGLPTVIENTESHVVDYYLQSRTTPIGYRYPVLRNSHLFHLFGSVYRQIQGWLADDQITQPSVFDDVWSDETVEQVRRTQHVFEGIFSLASQADMPVAVVMIPTLQQAAGDASANVQEVFGKYFENQKVPYLDLLPSFLGHPEAYYAADQHWNPLGHRIAAEALAEWLSTANFP